MVSRLDRAEERRLRVGCVVRYPDKIERSRRMADGYPNFYFHTSGLVGMTAAKLDAGVNRPKPVVSDGGLVRVPALLLRSSPGKTGTDVTPWEDIYDLDNGYIRYFGDNKTPGNDPISGARGNGYLLTQFELHQSGAAELRAQAAPVLIFRGVSRQGKRKGFVEFCGMGVISSAERVVQIDKSGASFVNYAFDIALFDLLDEDELFDWTWINARRDAAISDRDVLETAPKAWKEWVKSGNAAVPRLRRSVSRHSIVSKENQLPALRSNEARILHEVYEHYKGNEVKFEAIAAWITSRVLRRSGIYKPFGVTRASGDRGFDFVGRLTVGRPESGFGAVQAVVLGQAKCEKPNTPTNALHLARTVARLRRGWIGVFVTTSYFSRSAQQEVIQD
ncbi:MAG: restriction endonuclease, partial [Actinomycetes bacterium]